MVAFANYGYPRMNGCLRNHRAHFLYLLMVVKYRKNPFIEKVCLMHVHLGSYMDETPGFKEVSQANVEATNLQYTISDIVR